MINWPFHFQAILWSKDIKNLDPQADKNYIIHQVLMFGSLEDIEFLRTVYSDAEIKDVFLTKPEKIYTRPALNFVKNYLLSISGDIDESAYLTGSPRNIGRQETGNFSKTDSV